ncbi:MAG: ATP-grasp domain-containing protein, partial [Acidimicrobiia bacterium]|nr:ATP-grasp domain-containing protein [Acidimicrobiia bacterium]
MKVLIANRGEIARRIIRSCQDWGVPTVAVYADPDADAPFVADADEAVWIGPAELAKSYLAVEAILGAAATSGATHIHPGYGFLSERADFAQAVIDAGLGWIGPRPNAIESMGSKIEARSIAEAAGVPVIPGYNESQEDDDLREAATNIGYPILVKASAGGGGKGIRIAFAPEDFDQALNEARTESMRSFGDDAVIVERFITQPRHVEVQVAGDRAGNAIDLGTRECSVQRRYQKVLEEAPAPNLLPATRSGLRSSAAALTRSIGYDTVGTVEFIVDTANGDFFFLEMNTRIQVEHTVTEEVCDLDLIHLQILLATGADLPIDGDYFDANVHGHAFEARINAEDSWAGHIPQTGVVSTLEVPRSPHIRWDAAIEAGAEITPHYDSMIGKLIVHASSRSQALAHLDA